MKRLAAFLVLLLAVPALACPPGARVCVPAAPAVVVHRQAAVVVPVQTVAVVIPAYAISYNYAADQNAALVAELRALRDEVAKLRADAAAPVTVVPAAKPAAKPARDLVALLTVCSRCHQPATAAKLGGSFELFKADGTVVELDQAAAKKCRTLVESGKMPKGDTFSAAEKKTLLDYLDPAEPIAPPKE